VKLLTNHVLLMAIYASLAGAFFALLWKEETRERWKMLAIVSGALFFGGCLIAWIMYPFPIR